jgi:hypothetical protein
MARTVWGTAVLGFMFAVAACTEASAAWVGDYFFPSTLATTVPTPADFFNPPGFTLLPSTAVAREVDIPTTYSKLITPNWGVTVTETYRILEQGNTGTRQGFDNLTLGTQYQLYTNAEHQFVFTVGGTAALGGTGSPNVDTSYSTLTPTAYVGKAFGDLPASMAWLRPVALTAQVGVAVPTQSTTLAITPLTSTVTEPTGATAVTETVIPSILQWGFALEYSLLTTSYSGGGRKGSRYSEGWVPLVEFALRTPLGGALAGQTTGTVNPGVLWVGRYLQFGVEAIVPINGLSGHDIGVRAQAHLYLSEILPDTLGKPIFSK